MSRARDFADLAGSADAGGLTGRNLFINGAMQVAQRGTSVASSSGTIVRCVDRYRCFARGAGAATFSQTSTVPTGQGFANSLRVDVTTVDSSLATNDLYQIDQKFEGQDFQQLAKGTSDAKSVTASFWVRSTKTGTYILEFYDDDNNRGISKTYSISSADTWEYKTVTFEGDTTGALDNDNGSSVILRWFLAAGTNYTSGTLATAWASSVDANRVVGQVNFFDSISNDFYITGVQLEVGETATPFEHRSFGDELARCQRYYYRIASDQYAYFATGRVINTSDPLCAITFPTAMRLTPAVTSSNAATWYNNAGSIVGVVNPSVHYSSGENNITTLDVKFQASGTLASNNSPMLYAFNPAGYIDFDSEL